MKQLQKNEIYRIILADKNCGFSVIEIEHLTERGTIDHLKNAEVYRQLTKGETGSQLMGVEYLIEPFRSQHRNILSKAEVAYLKRGLRQKCGKMAHFYTNINVHRDWYKFRPIVSTYGTVLAITIYWLDYTLQHLKPFIKHS